MRVLGTKTNDIAKISSQQKQIVFKSTKADCAPIYKNEQEAAAGFAGQLGSDGPAAIGLEEAASLREDDFKNIIVNEIEHPVPIGNENLDDVDD